MQCMASFCLIPSWHRWFYSYFVEWESEGYRRWSSLLKAPELESGVGIQASPSNSRICLLTGFQFDEEWKEPRWRQSFTWPLWGFTMGSSLCKNVTSSTGGSWWHHWEWGRGDRSHCSLAEKPLVTCHEHRGHSRSHHVSPHRRCLFNKHYLILYARHSCKHITNINSFMFTPTLCGGQLPCQLHRWGNWSTKVWSNLVTS